jgi:hypothetical protein
MKSKKTLKALLVASILSVIPIVSFVHADVPTTVQYSSTTTSFALGSTSTTALCMTNETDPASAPSFNTGDVSAILIDPAIGVVTSVDTPVTVKSASLVPGDFTVALSGTYKIKLTYNNASSKLFQFGESVCAVVHFTANASPAGVLARFSNKFTGTTGLLPSVELQIADPALLPSGGLTSVNALPGSAPGSVFVGRSTGSNPGSSFTVAGGSPAAGATDVSGGDMVLSGGPGTGLGGGGNVRIQTAGQNDLSGTSDNLLVDREIFVARAKQLTLSAPGFTSLMSIHLTGTHTAGGRIFYTVRATDGGSQIATESGVIQYLATANSITCTVQTSDKLHLGTVNSGCTPGFFNPGSQPGVSIFDNVTFSSPAPIVVHEVYFRITNESGSSIRLEP